MKKTALIILISIYGFSCLAQTSAYEEKKKRALSEDSPFTKIINRELPATIEYEDDEIIAFVPLRRQAPVHLLIVPKKPIPSINDLDEEDALLVGKMFLIAKKLAAEKGVSETGFRLSINNNEDSGQSVFHLHLHLMGGKPLGPMVTQDYSEER